MTDAQCTNAKSFITTDLLGAFARNLKQDVFLGKLDYQLNQTNHLERGLSTSKTGRNRTATTPPHGQQRRRDARTEMAGRTSASSSPTGPQHFSSNRVNEFRFQWGRDFEFDSTNSGGPAASLLKSLPTARPPLFRVPAFPDEHRYQISDNFSVVHGKHFFKTGVDLNFIHELLINLFQGDGSYSYNTTTAIAGCPAGSQRHLLPLAGGRRRRRHRRRSNRAALCQLHPGQRSDHSCRQG